MEKIRLICVGRIKEPAIEALSKDYSKRIGAFLPFNLIELREARVNRDNADDPYVQEQFDKHIQSRDYLVLLDATGGKMSSERFAAWLSNHFSHNQSPLTFAIGGASGLPASLFPTSQLKLSFSDMTFPHELFRVMFLEQLYRALTIIHHHPYHR